MIAQTGGNPAPILRVLDIVVSSSLTIGLIYIYHKIKEENKRQTEVSKRQAEVADRQTKAIEKQTELIERQISIQESKSTVRLSISRWVVDRNRVELQLANFGEVPAQDLYLNIELQPLEKPFEEQVNEDGYIRISPSGELDPKYIEPDSGGIIEKQDENGSLARTIEPGEDGTFICDRTFSSIAYGPPEGNVTSFLEPEEYFEALREAGNKQLFYSIELEYEYRDTSDKTSVLGGYIDTESAKEIDSINLETLISNTDTLNHPENYVYPNLENVSEDVFYDRTQ